MGGKKELIGFRCNKQEKEAIEEIAKEQHMYPSSWVRKVIAERIEEIQKLKKALDGRAIEIYERGTRGKTVSKLSR